MVFWKNNLSDSTFQRSSRIFISLSVFRQFFHLATSRKAVLFDVQNLKLNPPFESIDRDSW